jgi:hypothetical protein
MELHEPARGAAAVPVATGIGALRNQPSRRPLRRRTRSPRKDFLFLAAAVSSVIQIDGSLGNAGAWPCWTFLRAGGAPSRHPGHELHAGNRRMEVEDEGKEDISPHFFTRIRLQVGLRRRRGYIMAYLKQQRNYNGTDVVSRIVMVCFKIVTIIMVQIQLTLFFIVLFEFHIKDIDMNFCEPGC